MATSHRTNTILVVDDEKMVLNLVSAILETGGYKVLRGHERARSNLFVPGSPRADSFGIARRDYAGHEWP